MTLSISIVIPSYNEEKYIGQCLTALTNQNYPKSDYEIIVVDNNSTDKTVEIAKKYQVKILTDQPGNVGKIRNLGAEVAKGKILGFIDADCVTDPDWLQRVENLIKNNISTVFGGGCLLPENPTAIEKYWLLGSDDTRLPNDLIGASLAVSKENFDKIGGFNENITSGEDTVFSKQAEILGLTVKVVPELSVIHLGNAKTVKEFTARQVWHSENYISDFRNSLKDPTFWLISFSSIFLLSTIVGAITLSFDIAIWSIAIFMFIPLVFSFKRVIRSRTIPSAIALPHIYGLDFLYVQARSYSLFRSLFRSLIELKIR